MLQALATLNGAEARVSGMQSFPLTEVNGNKDAGGIVCLQKYTTVGCALSAGVVFPNTFMLL
jgi:hypothetical protein